MDSQKHETARISCSVFSFLDDRIGERFNSLPSKAVHAGVIRVR
jgi:hypothetical protein